jgi:hypothetical protein
MSGQDWPPYVIVLLLAGLIMWRLDRLGKQLEAVRDHLLIELGSEETRSEVLQEREWEKKERRKERRQFWAFWGIVGLAAIIWYAASRH